MSSQVVRSVFLSKLQAEFSAYDIIDATNINIDRGVDDSPWIAVYFNGGVEEHIAVGDENNNRYREIGTVDIYACVQAGSGSSVAISIVESLRTSFRAKNLSSGSGKINTYTADPPTQSDRIGPAIKSGSWYVIGTTIEYDFDYYA